jgi:hypothetical protein
MTTSRAHRTALPANSLVCFNDGQPPPPSCIKVGREVFDTPHVFPPACDAVITASAVSFRL